MSARKTTLIGKRRIYYGARLDSRSALNDPIKQFSKWFRTAERRSMGEPHAMALSTVRGGSPKSRQVLLREFDKRGFCFYTNYKSPKARDLEENPRAALLFYWPEVERQVRIEGKVVKVSAASSDDYFATRPRGSQLGAWASAQSAVLRDRNSLLERIKILSKKFPGPVPRPDWWGGYRLVPHRFEFWSGRPDRLHDRIEYFRSGSRWKMRRLSP